MPAGDPIRLGSAGSGELVPDSNSQITTNDYGIQKGTVNYKIGDQANSQSARFALGATYSGTLPQFNGFLVNRSGDITGGDARTAQIAVEYVRQDPLWRNIPLDSADLELKQIQAAPTPSGLGSLYDTILTITIPLLHPTVGYRYSSLTAKSDLGNYGNPPQAPSLRNYIFHVESYAFDSPSVDIEQKSITTTATLLTIQQNGQCTRTNFTSSSTVTGVFGTSQAGLINMIDLVFQPDPKGWLCVKQDQTPLAAGAIYEIDEQWKTQYIYSGTVPGDWWTGGHIVHCT